MPKQTVTEAATSAREWRAGREQGVIFHFPSGLTARVRPVNARTFISLGRIPDTLTMIVEKSLKGDLDLEALTLKEIADLHQVYDIFCETAFVEPRIVAVVSNPDTEITIDDVPDLDKQTLFQFMGAPASMLADFRPYQTNHVDDMGSQPGNPTITK